MRASRNFLGFSVAQRNFFKKRASTRTHFGIGPRRSSGIPGSITHKAMNDLTTSATLAFQSGEGEEKEVQRSWSQLAKRFWIEMTKHGENERQQRVKKLVRTKAYSWLIATSHMLMVCSGVGWSAYKVHQGEGELVAPSDQRVAVVTIDQGGDGWSAVHFLMATHHCLLLLVDQSHRCWNDFQLALQDSKLYSWTLVTICLLNLDHGPWNGARWWQEMKEGCREYLHVAGPDCVVWQGHLPQVLAEMGEEPMIEGAEERNAALFYSLSDCVERKVERVGMSRWFQYVSAVRAFLRMWSRRCVVLIYICLMLGTFRQCHYLQELQLPVTGKVDGEDVAKSSTKDDQEHIRKLRAKCSNSLEFAAIMLSDRRLYKINVIISTIGQSIQEWHSNQNVQNRSSKASCQWWSDMAVERGRTHLDKMMACLRDRDFMIALELHITTAPAELLSIDYQDPLVDKEDEIAQKVGSLVIAVLSRRIRTLSWHEGLPGIWPALLVESEREQAIGRIRQVVEDWRNAEGWDSGVWKKLRERSPLNQEYNKLLLRVLEGNGWEASEELLTMISDHFGGVTNTKIVEDSVRQGRVAEVSKAFKKVVSGKRCWGDLITSGVENAVHHFDALEYEDLVVPRGLQDADVRGLFVPNPALVPKEYKNIVGTARKSDFYSPAPLLANAHVEDAALLRECLSKDLMGRAGESWHSMLAHQGKVLIRHAQRTSGKWVLSLSSIAGHCTMGLPVEEQ
eukprot:6489836-Amphidinium_carterae.1